jgi:hypothetical protein
LPTSTAATIQFYWISGNNATAAPFPVTQDVTRGSPVVEEANPSSSVSYIVHTPGSPEPLATYQPTQYGPYKTGVTALSSGTLLSPPSSLGLILNFLATSPAAITGYSGGGYFSASQVIVSLTGPHPSPPPVPPAADGCPVFTTMYSGGTYVNGPVKEFWPGTNVTINAVDAPDTTAEPNDNSSFTYATGFLDYFIYRPTGKNAIWVTISTLGWSYGGTLTANGSGVVTASALINSSSSTPLATATALPYWTSINGTSQCPTLPTQ